MVVKSESGKNISYLVMDDELLCFEVLNRAMNLGAKINIICDKGGKCAEKNANIDSSAPFFRYTKRQERPLLQVDDDVEGETFIAIAHRNLAAVGQAVQIPLEACER